jgi:outer membrane protein insertion porin family
MILALCAVGSAQTPATPSAPTPGTLAPIPAAPTQTPPADQSTVGTVTEIVITGNQHVNNDTILIRMKTKVGQAYKPDQLDQDRDLIAQLGYFKAVDVHGVPLAGNNWRINVDVSEYPVVKEFRVTGNTVLPTDAILKVVTLRVDQPYNANLADSSNVAIVKLYSDKGYFVVLTDLAPLEDSPGTVNIAIHEQRVNSVGVEGNTRTKNRVMRHLIKTKAGDAFNSKKWDDDYKRMATIGWFDKVTLDDKMTPDNDVDLLAVVKEGRTGAATVGVSLDPSTGLAGSANLKDSNFNGTGQSVGISFLQAITGGGPSVDLTYGNPFIDNHDTSFSASLYSHLFYRFTGSGFGEIASTSSSLYTERRTGGVVQFIRPVQEQVNALVGARYEGVKTSDVGSATQSSFIRQDGTVGTLSFGLIVNRRDLDLDPSRGDYLSLLVEPGMANINEIAGAIENRDILGTHTFNRDTLEYKVYWTPQPPRGRNLDAPRKVFALRVKYGTITGFAPFFEQFFMGGADTLRGYDDERYWGTQELLTTLEYRYPIQKSFDLVPFVDYGGAWGGYGSVNTYYQYNSLRLHLDYGLGVRFRTPLGQVGIYFALNERGGGRTTFLIGPAF